ncbi:MAG: osmoprotectant transport system substrate-binding protein [Actinomycetota bacterium]|jgi:osmoprotectant transport system substrate-binding protein
MKHSIRLLLALLLGAAVLGACGGDDKKASDNNGGKDSGTNAGVSVKIGAQNFGESEILAEIYKQGLAKYGFDTSVEELGGDRAVELTAFSDKKINFAPEYAASMLEFLNEKKGEATGDVAATVAKLAPYLTTKGLAALKSSAAVDTNAFVMTKKKSDELGIKTLSDLAAKGKDLKIGAPQDCETNPFCIPGLKSAYGLDLAKNFTALGAGPVIDSLDADSIQIGLLFSTDGRIVSKGYVLLTDDKHMLAADNVVPVVTTALAGNAELVEYANAISAKLTTAKLIAMNKRFDIDKDDASVIAKEFLTDEGLI